jgi:hypothetical protein
MVAAQQEAEATREAEAFLLREQLAELEAAHAGMHAAASPEQDSGSMPGADAAAAADQEAAEAAGSAQEQADALEATNAQLRAALAAARQQLAAAEDTAAARQLALVRERTDAALGGGSDAQPARAQVPLPPAP